MPAAAVIPAPIAYIKVVAVKKFVVGSQARARGSPRGDTARRGHTPTSPSVLLTECLRRSERLL